MDTERYIVVGNGLAAQVLAHQLIEYQIPFRLIGKKELSSSSRIAAGIWNPLVFKRMTSSWMAGELIRELHLFYRTCEQRMNRTFLHNRILIRPFTEEQEKQLWLKRAQNELSAFIRPEIHTKVPQEFSDCSIPNGYGLVEQCGNLNLRDFLESGDRYFSEHLQQEQFDHHQLLVRSDHIQYKSIRAKGIIFCEGHLVSDNPFFSWLPMKPVKGELMRVKIPGLNFGKGLLNKNGFLMDLEAEDFLCGATYDWDDLNDCTTARGLAELKAKLENMFKGEYNITARFAGVRPSSIDRRPILGSHPRYGNVYVFNGLGAKGVMLAPYFARKFVHFLLKKDSLPAEVDVQRFYQNYADKKT
ncbi:MAG TPA: FAD-binding oxidoreductase [Bacteroidia bacterium]|nr:FAD-binding oxidoreductase [Bacteroidia bacterium]